ncbi:putative Ig domain-containing protein [Arthrobacter sp. UKPF54-2]|uniref:putative Ig domain-containing protein n=1 Tax=Arthrobacter sp. UKPF54-2 TaxID=2600159 RepID=UPI0016455EF0|nr:putative Ig domain-containing protein [Arthrobacter sp. UKPF54-2]
MSLIEIRPAQAAPVFTASTPPGTATVGSPYSYTFAASGNPAPSFNVASGSLPAGLALNSASGMLSGTPTAAGSSTFTVAATNGVSPDAVTPSRTITVSAAQAAPVFTASTPPGTATVGSPYSYTFAASGNPAPSFNVASGSLPAGLALNSASGMLSGTPTAAGSSTFTVAATNGVSPDAVTPSRTITVSAAQAAPVFTASTPPATATVGSPYSYTFAASGNPAPTFNVASGSLPAGLALNSASGVLSGTPTAAGSSTFTVAATNGVSPDAVTPSRTITVSDAQAAPVFTASTPPGTATVGSPYSYTFAASGNPAPTFNVASGSLPAGLALNSASGVLSGTPTAAGSSTFTVAATNGVSPDAVTPSRTITVSDAQAAPVFTASTPPGTATVGSPYSYTFAASGNPAPSFNVASGSLPAGLALNSASGVLSGTPTAAGSSTFTVAATNGVSPDAVTPVITIAVDPAPSPDGTQAAVVFGWGPVVTGDEFSYTGAPNPLKWGVYNSPGHAGNGIRSPGAWSVDGSIVTVSGDSAGTTGGMSAKFAQQKYGRWETRMRTSARDPKYHPVLILWPNNNTSPNCAEIDYAEGTSDTSRIKFFLHYACSGSNFQTQSAQPIDTTQWHNYAVQWTPAGITGYIDGVQWFTDTDPAHQPTVGMHQTIQLDWFPDGTSTQPSQMQVDWVRVYN